VLNEKVHVLVFCQIPLVIIRSQAEADRHTSELIFRFGKDFGETSNGMTLIPTTIKKWMLPEPEGGSINRQTGTHRHTMTVPKRAKQEWRVVGNLTHSSTPVVVISILRTSYTGLKKGHFLPAYCSRHHSIIWTLHTNNTWHDFWLPPRSRWDLRSSGILRST